MMRDLPPPPPTPNLSMSMARLHFVSYSMKQSMCVVLPSLPIDLLCVAGETGDCKAGTGGRRSSSNCSSLSTTYRRDRRALASPPLTLCRRNRGHSFRKVYKAMGTLCKQQQQQEEAAVEEAGVQAIASKSHGSDDNNDDDDVVVTVDMNQWPKPLSPLSGDIGKGIELQRALKAEASMASQPAFSPSDIIYQDEWLFVINKPSGIYAGHVLETVTSMLSPKKQCEEVSEVVEEDSTGSCPPQPHLHLANRLDRDTSGVMIVSKCKIVAGKLTRMFQNRKAKKTYIALCIGKRPVWNEIYVETGHGRSRWGAWRVYANEDIGLKLPEKASVKDMATRFEVLSINGEMVPQSQASSDDEQLCERRVAERGEPYENVFPSGDEIIVRAFPVTGRTHQIRLHCQFLGIPLLGDVKYGGPLVWKGVSYEAHTLHAESMSFRHPVTDEELSLLAPVPKWAVI